MCGMNELTWHLLQPRHQHLLPYMTWVFLYITKIFCAYNYKTNQHFMNLHMPLGPYYYIESQWTSCQSHVVSIMTQQLLI